MKLARWLIILLYGFFCLVGSYLLCITHQPVYSLELEFAVVTASSKQPIEQHQADLTFVQTYKSYLQSAAFLTAVSSQPVKKARKSIRARQLDDTLLVVVEVRASSVEEVRKLSHAVSKKWQEDSQTIFGQQNVSLLSDSSAMPVNRIDLFAWQRILIWWFSVTLLFLIGVHFYRVKRSR